MLLSVATVALFGIYYLSIRFLLVFLPVLLLWASNGIIELARWGRSSFRLAYGGLPKFRWTELVVVGAIGALIPLVCPDNGARLYELRLFDRSSRPAKDAAEWLDAYAPGPKTVMDTSTIVAFHAAATFVPFPYCSSDVALRYADKRKVDFVILRDAMYCQGPIWSIGWKAGFPTDGPLLSTVPGRLRLAGS